MASPVEFNQKNATIEPGTHVRSVNGIYKSVGVGRVQKVRDEICKVEFNPSVFSKPPHRSINYLLKIPELEVCPTPLELARAGQWDEAWKFDLRQMAARFLTLNKGGQLSNARTEILPHQIFTAFADWCFPETLRFFVQIRFASREGNGIRFTERMFRNWRELSRSPSEKSQSLKRTDPALYGGPAVKSNRVGKRA